MSEGAGEAVRLSLEGREIHEAWERVYRSDTNERFYELAFDMFLQYAGGPRGTAFLDVGCGPGFHALRLARRGYRVRAVDFSPSVLELARKNVDGARMQDQIRVSREDVTALSFADRCFDRVLCWGVLMHIPDIDQAVAELSRVLADGGRLVVSELNSRSLERVSLRVVKRALGRTNGMRRTPAGIEHWKQTSAGPLMSREADVGWLVDAFGQHGVRLVKLLPAQFSEAYAKLGPRLGGTVHSLNRAWLQYVRSPRFAAGNILVLEKSPGAAPQRG